MNAARKRLESRLSRRSSTPQCSICRELAIQSADSESYSGLPQACHTTQPPVRQRAPHRVRLLFPPPPCRLRRRRRRRPTWTSLQLSRRRVLSQLSRPMVSLICHQLGARLTGSSRAQLQRRPSTRFHGSSSDQRKPRSRKWHWPDSPAHILSFSATREYPPGQRHISLGCD